ncbi:MAG: porin [Proteobacteria bacterium]|nr:porin [Pseudomonadota bacterium]
MKRTTLYLALVGCFAASALATTPVFADDMSDLKAEIAAQKKAATAQQARLEALEKKLEGALAQQSAAKAPTKSTGSADWNMEGLTYKSADRYISLYGLIDLPFSSVTHKDAAGNSLRAFQTPWFSGSRWGIRGSRDLGAGGLKVITKLESEYVLATGEEDTAGVLFNRDAWVGFESDFLGKLTFGRQNTLARDFSAIYGDPYIGAKQTLEEGGYTSTNNFKHLLYYAGGASGTRLNNGIVWKKDFGGGLIAGLAYAFGGGPGSPATSGTAANQSEGTTSSASLAYNIGNFNMSGFVTTAKVDGLTDDAYSFGGNYTMGAWRVNAGYYHYQGAQGALGQRKDDAYTISLKFAPPGKLDYELGYQSMQAKNAALSKPVGGIVRNAFASVTGLTKTGSGDRNTLYGSIFYHFTPSTEVYLAADYLKLDAGYGTVNGSANQTEVAVGVRTRF